MRNRFLCSISHKNDNISNKKIGRGVTKEFLCSFIYFLYNSTRKSLGNDGTMWKSVAIMPRQTEGKTIFSHTAVWFSIFVLIIFVAFFSERNCPIQNSTLFEECWDRKTIERKVNCDNSYCNQKSVLRFEEKAQSCKYLWMVKQWENQAKGYVLTRYWFVIPTLFMKRKIQLFEIW